MKAFFLCSNAKLYPFLISYQGGEQKSHKSKKWRK
nr:MAG TPA_asm: hypothetical protein [Caudoviricetes sp.]